MRHVGARGGRHVSGLQSQKLTPHEKSIRHFISHFRVSSFFLPADFQNNYVSKMGLVTNLYIPYVRSSTHSVHF